VKLRFLGTRGEIEASSPRHRRHSVLVVSHHGRPLLVDCGRDWLGQLPRVDAQALLLMHAHPDHVAGLRGGCPWPVYIGRVDGQSLARVPTIANLQGVSFEAVWSTPLSGNGQSDAITFRSNPVCGSPPRSTRGALVVVPLPEWSP
jgi:glyoxylase-like metal-dependent hydrolase (beta-lactamase superfamily II)